ncbi:Uncharacterised protein [uncultured Ruminococcus sp.]|nr:Uncharacterised protein [uncultured Ruminococcus sp.]SCI20459.1 Uncharacterised protein [uncultured Clostridium sp.]
MKTKEELMQMSKEELVEYFISLAAIHKKTAFYAP